MTEIPPLPPPLLQNIEIKLHTVIELMKLNRIFKYVLAKYPYGFNGLFLLFS